MENNRNVQSLRRGLSHLALWELFLLAFVLVTFFGLLDHTKDSAKNSSDTFTRTSYQTKVDLYDLRIEDNSQSINDRVETGL